MDRVPGPMLLDLTLNSFILLGFASSLNCLLYSTLVLWLHIIDLVLFSFCVQLGFLCKAAVL